MDPSVKVFTPSEMDGWGQYMIAPGATHCLPFQIPVGGSITLVIAHIWPNSQDFSIDYWFSTVPLDQQILSPGFGHGKANRQQRRFEFVDIDLHEGEADDRVAWTAGVDIWLNVKNLQNSQNAYQAEFVQPTDKNTCC